MANDTTDVIDLFCGAGGLTAGLERAGWKTVAAVDSDADAIATLRATQAAKIKIGKSRGHYLAGTQIVESDISLVRGCELRPAA
jgi:DNA (cytosine-5)-methyltransferase 1